MVHIPLLGIDVPEPRLEYLIPDALETFIHILARILDAAQDFVHPLDSEAQEDYEEAVASCIAPEFFPVMKRLNEGKILNTEQLSSEADEASFDFYRRGIREGMVGLKDETGYERTMRRLGEGEMTSLEATWLQHHHDRQVALLRNPGSCDPSDSSNEAELPIVDVQELLTSVARRIDLAVLEEEGEAAHRQRWVDLERRVKTGRMQTALAAGHASLGLVAGLAIARGVGFMVMRLVKRRQQRRRRAAKAVAAAAAAAPAVRPAPVQEGTSPAAPGARPSPVSEGAAPTAASAAAAAAAAAKEVSGGRRTRTGARVR